MLAVCFQVCGRYCGCLIKSGVGWKYTYMLCDCEENCVPLYEEAAKISSPFVTSVYLNKGQFIHWHRTACMISSIETEKEHLYNRRHNLRTGGVQFDRRKCGNQQLFKVNKSVTAKQKKYIRKYLLNTNISSKCLMLTEKSLINFIDTKCLNS